MNRAVVAVGVVEVETPVALVGWTFAAGMVHRYRHLFNGHIVRSMHCAAAAAVAVIKEEEEEVVE